MNKKASLIIGSNNFLGNVLSRKLVERGDAVQGVYHKNTYNLFEGIRHFPVSDLDNLEDNYDTIYLISAYVPEHNDATDENKILEVNIRLVETVSKQFPSAKLVFTSSVSVYENTEDIIVENSNLNPNSKYAVSKLHGEEIVKKHLKYAIVRISSMYGVNMKLHTFLPAICQQALRTKEITVYGNGERMQNYVYVEDAANYLIGAAEFYQNDTFLAIGKESISNKELAKLVSLNIKNSEIKFVGKDKSPSYNYNNVYTRETLKIATHTTIENGIKNIIEWMRKR